jgi:hypothetical protein
MSNEELASSVSRLRCRGPWEIHWNVAMSPNVSLRINRWTKLIQNNNSGLVSVNLVEVVSIGREIMKLAAFLLFLLAADASRIPAHFARSSRFLTSNVLASSPPVNSSTEIGLKQVLPSADVPESTDVPVTDATSVNPQPSGQPVSIATPTMGIALNLGLCKNTTLPECESNSVFSPLSIASTMTLLMAGKYESNCF